MTRTITASTTSQRERTVVASILASCGGVWPAHVVMAVSYAPTYWDDPVAGRLAVACMRAYRESKRVTDPVVSEYLDAKDHAWLAHPSFNADLPLDLADVEACDLVIRYQGKRLNESLGKAHTELQAHPEKARELAMALKVQLEEWLS